MRGAGGTHAVIQDQVQFKNLALAIIDEQHRFGVAQRLALRGKMREEGHEPHLLMMSATPIPRTLEMSLTGIRDLSLLQTPPAERQPILTYVGEYDERAVAEAIRRATRRARWQLAAALLLAAGAELAHQLGGEAGAWGMAGLAMRSMPARGRLIAMLLFGLLLLRPWGI